MKIKKFKAKNFSEALELVKKELSEDAIILSTEEKKGIRSFVEVTAAVDYDSSLHTVGRQIEGSSGHAALDDRVDNVSDRVSLKPVSLHSVTTLPTAAVDEIKNEIEKIRGTIEEMKNNGYDISLPSKKRTILNFLRERAVKEEFALRICEKARDIDDIPSLISEDIRVKGQNNDDYSDRGDFPKKAIMLIGPTGVGKTTTIAKLTASEIKKGKRVAIINLDTYRIGAPEQIRIYANIMGIPLSTVSSSDEMRNNLLKFLHNRDTVFIDTTGRNPKNETYIREILETCHCLSSIDSSGDFSTELHLLISANSDDEFMIDSYRHYSRLPLNYIAFTKIDEAVRFGSIYNLLLVYQKPVAYITTGQCVPNDIEFITANGLSNLILQKGSC